MPFSASAWFAARAATVFWAGLHCSLREAGSSSSALVSYCLTVNMRFDIIALAF